MRRQAGAAVMGLQEEETLRHEVFTGGGGLQGEGGGGGQTL